MCLYIHTNTCIYSAARQSSWAKSDDAEGEGGMPPAIGIDAEWKPVRKHGEKEVISIFQVSKLCIYFSVCIVASGLHCKLTCVFYLASSILRLLSCVFYLASSILRLLSCMHLQNLPCGDKINPCLSRVGHQILPLANQLRAAKRLSTVFGTNLQPGNLAKPESDHVAYQNHFTESDHVAYQNLFTESDHVAYQNLFTKNETWKAIMIYFARGCSHLFQCLCPARKSKPMSESCGA
jgi:hypothetical protein